MASINDTSRETVLRAVRRELLGPAACGLALSIPAIGSNKEKRISWLRNRNFSGLSPIAKLDNYLHLKSLDNASINSFMPQIHAQTGEEVLMREKPLDRYGLGILFPKDVDGMVIDNAEDNPTQEVESDVTEPLLPKAVDQRLKKIGDEVTKGGAVNGEDETEPAELIDASTRQPSSMAVSFRIKDAKGAMITVRLPKIDSESGQPVNGRYSMFSPPTERLENKPGKAYQWWVRHQISGYTTFKIPENIFESTKKRIPAVSSGFVDLGPLELDISCFARKVPNSSENELLLTVVLSNRTERGDSKLSDTKTLFQAFFEVEIEESVGKFYPLSGGQILDSAGKGLNFLYRKSQAYAVGHGCAADWVINDNKRIIKATHFPTYEVQSMTPDIHMSDGGKLQISMVALSKADDNPAALDALDELILEYEYWLQSQKQVWEIELEQEQDSGLNQEVVDQNFKNATQALTRMKAGINLLRTDTKARQAFSLMNEAMALQQATPRGLTRNITLVKNRVTFEDPFNRPTLSSLPEDRGMWRPFQIGFILSALMSTTNLLDLDRELVDVIWFPTGGGKTEAYLGLIAYSAFLRRLKDPKDTGTDCLMRYTLRLLTAQQFERSSALICAMNILRRERVHSLGEKGFSIGLWVGADTTPNTRANAKKALEDPKSQNNPFLVSRCPWCAAQLGVVAGQKGNRQFHGFVPNRSKGVTMRCPDQNCDFYSGLPLEVVDEELYDNPPTILLATVDKYAQIIRKPEARVFFGIGADGNREFNPPNLIIQDELHLITGPLGSMVGALEGVIEHLCSVPKENGTQEFIKPKIVTSTATVRNYADQVRWLFAREQSALFPPPVLDINDSFFGVKAKTKDGIDAPGRKYLGIYAPALRSHITVQIRVFAAALQAVMALPEEHRDPYWTLLGFFNTLRDLGSTTSLLRLQIPSHLNLMFKRLGIDGKEMRSYRRYYSDPVELTGRLENHEITPRLELLATSKGSGGTVVDICLASSMIEVGIDIDRLALMVITGQPKTNAQYIQVSGRVGRDPKERPGLVITAYAPNRARDRSVFESFRTNHESLYAEVEPASVTPFSIPALERMLHAMLIAYIRQTKPLTFNTPAEVTEDDFHNIREILYTRIATVDPDAKEDAAKWFNKRAKEWITSAPLDWESITNEDVLYVLDSTEKSSLPIGMWRVPLSLRNVEQGALVDARVSRLVQMKSNET